MCRTRVWRPFLLYLKTVGPEISIEESRVRAPVFWKEKTVCVHGLRVRTRFVTSGGKCWAALVSWEDI